MSRQRKAFHAPLQPKWSLLPLCAGVILTSGVAWTSPPTTTPVRRVEPEGAHNPTVVTKRLMRGIARGKWPLARFVDFGRGVVFLTYLVDDSDVRKGRRVCGRRLERRLEDLEKKLRLLAPEADEFWCRNEPTMKCALGSEGESAGTWEFWFGGTSRGEIVLETVFERNSTYRNKRGERRFSQKQLERLGTTLCPPSAGGDTVAEQLLRRVRHKDLDVVEDMKSMGPEIVPSLVPLARHGDRDVRELALYCLEQKGGRRARAAFVRALYDRDLQIRAIAATGFLQRHHGPENLSALLKVLRAHRDGLVREHVALVIGKIGQPRVVAALKSMRRAEKNRLVRNNIRLALARLGDKPSQKSILNGIRAEKIKVRLKAVRDFGYMNDRRLVVHLLPLLEDRRNAVNVAPSGHKAYVRMCDVAVEVLDTILDHPFSFQVGSVGRVRRYSPEEIAEARSLVGKEIGVQ